MQDGYRVRVWDHQGPVGLLVLVIICGRSFGKVGGSAAGGMLERRVYLVYLRREFTACTPS